MSDVTGDDAEHAESIMGYSIGGFVTFALNQQFAIRPEVMFSAKGFDFNHSVLTTLSDVLLDIHYNAEDRFNYLEIPVLGVYSLNPSINIFAGPYLEIFLNGSEKYDSTTKFEYDLNGTTYADSENDSGSYDIESDDINSPGYGVTVGAEYVNSQFSFGLRYSKAFTEVYKDFDFQFSTIQLMFGISL